MRNGYFYINILIFGLVGIQTSYADFTTSLPRCEVPAFDPEQQNYGNGLNCDFIKAYQGVIDPVSREESESLAALLPSPDFNYWTIRLDWNVISQTLRKIRNDTQEGVFSVPAEVITQKVKYGTSNVLDFGIGYTWKDWQMELEYFKVKDMTYNANPVLDNVGGVENSMASEIKPTVLIFNLYRNLGSWYYVKPYVLVGVGIARNKMNIDLTGALTGSGNSTSGKGIWDLRNYSFPVQVAAGIRFLLFPQVLLDIKYRYANMGNLHWEPVENLFVLKGNYQVTGWGLGVVVWLDRFWV